MNNLLLGLVPERIRAGPMATLFCCMTHRGHWIEISLLILLIFTITCQMGR